MAKQWYVVRVQSGREDKVKETLEKRVKGQGLDEAITRIIVPSMKVSEIRGGKKRVGDKKIYPGYLMVEMDLNEQSWFLIRETPGIGDFLGSSHPVPMAQHEVDKLLVDMSSGGDKTPQVKIDFKKGDSIRIKEGPFENFDGLVDSVIPAKGQVMVIVTIFGRPTPVQLEYWQIEAV
ncbi:MAG: transcription termination/antitermination factor NusG [Planctomycetes bacterium]|nr:transcription termination/antitermination factor NusG [Planctomycetota bacterium]